MNKTAAKVPGSLIALPFVGGGSFWNPPASGGYMGGCITGEAASAAYLQYLTEPPEHGGGTLQLVAISFADRVAAARTDAERYALRGQMVGFFSNLDRVLREAMTDRRLSAEWSPDRIAARMQCGAELDEEALCLADEWERRSASAKRGWQRRRRKAAARKSAAK